MSASKSVAAIVRGASRITSRPLVRSQLRQSRPALSRDPQPSIPTYARCIHSIPRPPTHSPRTNQKTIREQQEKEQQQDSTVKSRKLVEPHYQLTFTCVPCTGRSTHIVSKQGYHRGSVLITCPSCHNRHVISDHLNIFGDRKVTVEDLMREKGQLVKRGTLGEDGDIEFWPDETAAVAGSAPGTP